MNADALNDLYAAAIAADPACSGCALIGAQSTQPGWLVVERGDGLRVRIDGVAEDSPAVAAVLALDLSAEAVAARELGRTRAAALAGLLTRADSIALATRAALSALTYLLNNRLEAIDAQLRFLLQPGLESPRILESEILAYLTANPTTGDPKEPTPPPSPPPPPPPLIPPPEFSKPSPVPPAPL